MAGYRQQNYGRGRRRGSGCGPRIMIALVMVAFALGSYFMSTRKEYNPITGEEQRIALSAEEEIAMGLHAAPRMAQQHGGLHASQEGQMIVDQIGARLVNQTAASTTPYQFEFHLLADEMTVNAFALPGGQIFITAALFSRLKTEDELAGVLGHEIGHVVGRHSSEQIAKQKMTQGLTTAAILATTGGGQGNAGMAQMVGKLLTTKYGRDHELESDDLGVRFMLEAGYDPEALIQVMQVLKEAAGGGGRQPEFFSTHPNPENRVGKIKEAIAKYQGQIGQAR